MNIYSNDEVIGGEEGIDMPTWTRAVGVLRGRKRMERRHWIDRCEEWPTKRDEGCRGSVVEGLSSGYWDMLDLQVSQ